MEIFCDKLETGEKWRVGKDKNIKKNLVLQTFPFSDFDYNNLCVCTFVRF